MYISLKINNIEFQWNGNQNSNSTYYHIESQLNIAIHILQGMLSTAWFYELYTWQSQDNLEMILLINNLQGKLSTYRPVNTNKMSVARHKTVVSPVLMNRRYQSCKVSSILAQC